MRNGNMLILAGLACCSIIITRSVVDAYSHVLGNYILYGVLRTEHAVVLAI